MILFVIEESILFKGIITPDSQVWGIDPALARDREETLCTRFQRDDAGMRLAQHASETTHPESRSTNINDLFKSGGQNTHADTERVGGGGKGKVGHMIRVIGAS